MNEITKELMEALKGCERIMSCFELDGFETKAARAAIAKAEAALSEPRADEDGWIPWSGGGCPVHGSALVTIKTKSGAKSTGPAKIWQWRHLGHLGDIIAYRIAKGADK